jgi:subtilisin family serine protease
MDVRAQEAVGWSGQPGGVRYFAAAGNQGFAFPMPPAAWPGVIGVEACSGTSMERDTRFSNRGTTTASVAQPAHRARGAYFASPEALDGAALVYWGTSFAAPSAAVHAATEPPRLDASGQAVAFPVDPEYANWCGL